MKFIVSSSQLLKQLQVLGGVINSNNTLPILENLFFDFRSGFRHISNAGLNHPNGGVNDLVLSGGVFINL